MVIGAFFFKGRGGAGRGGAEGLYLKIFFSKGNWNT